MNEVLVIVNGMSEKTRKAFLAEVEELRRTYSKDLATERGSSIDMFEDFNVADKDRTDADGYFHQRWRNDRNQTAEMDRHIIRQFLMESLPSIVKTCCCSSQDQPVYLFNESYIIKEPGSNVAFRWHTDANEQLCSQTTPEYYSCWCALDDANEANGTLFFPQSTVISEWQAIHSSDESSLTLERCSHQRELRQPNETDHAAVPSSSSSAAAAAAAAPSTSSSTGIKTYDTDTDTGTIPGDDDIGMPVTVSAGSIVLFSSSQWHRSSINTTDHPRRVLYVQYSFDVISSTGDGGSAKPLCFAVVCSPTITAPNPDANSNPVVMHAPPMTDIVASESAVESPFLPSKRHKQR